MSTTNTTMRKSFQATAAAIATGVRVKLDSNGLISAAGATEHAIGTTCGPVAASGYGEVQLWGPSVLVTAGAAVARGAALYPLASGKVDDTGTTVMGLVSGEAATADGDIIEAFQSKVGA